MVKGIGDWRREVASISFRNLAKTWSIFWVEKRPQTYIADWHYLVRWIKLNALYGKSKGVRVWYNVGDEERG